MFGEIQVGDTPVEQPDRQRRAIPADVKPVQDIPMILNDAGVIGFSLNGKSFRHRADRGQEGEWVTMTSSMRASSSPDAPPQSCS